MQYPLFRPQIPDTRDAPARASRARALMTPAHVDAIREIRKKMLFSLRGDIPTALADMLDRKIQYEDASLCAMLGADETKAEIRAQASAVLRSEYFIQKPLDANLL